jgi:hypothetical protein
LVGVVILDLVLYVLLVKLTNRKVDRGRIIFRELDRTTIFRFINIFSLSWQRAAIIIHFLLSL